MVDGHSQIGSAFKALRVPGTQRAEFIDDPALATARLFRRFFDLARSDVPESGGFIDALCQQQVEVVEQKLAALLKPKFLRIGGYWYPRGGMPIDVFWQTGKLPAWVWLPDQGAAPYRGRG